MAEFVLYRKYRPKSFNDVLGQDYIVKTLSGAIRNNRLSHAYLFAGPRGTGKTSIARILASELKTSNKDLYELDAASNGGIDEIREVCDGARTLPFDSAKKVYIIDEVHMLSRGAFNALLKTLEEPPVHAIFILATTELHKVPDTVVSRCQIFNFKKPSHQILREMVKVVSKKEGYKTDDDAADLMALLGDGSFRDTHGILQKIISTSSSKNLVLKDVEDITGAPQSAIIRGVIKSILDRNLPEAIALLRQSSKDNVDSRIFIKMLIHHLRLVLLIKFAPELENEILDEFSADGALFFKECGNHKNVVAMPTVLRELLFAYEETRSAYIGELPLELTLIRLLT